MQSYQVKSGTSPLHFRPGGTAEEEQRGACQNKRCRHSTATMGVKSHQSRSRKSTKQNSAKDQRENESRPSVQNDCVSEKSVGRR